MALKTYHNPTRNIIVKKSSQTVWILMLFILFLPGFILGQTFIKPYEDPLARDPFEFHFIDFDLDDDPDIILNQGSDRPAAVLYENINGQYSKLPDDPFNLTGQIALIDYQDDGDVDVFYYNVKDTIDPETSTASIKVFRNENGTFVPDTLFQNLNFIHIINQSIIQCDDVDFDEDLDFFAATSAGYVLIRNDSGTFTFVNLIIPLGQPIRGFNVSDLDNDGFFDIVADCGYGGVENVRIFMADTTITIFSDPLFSFNSALIDYDNDKDHDVYVWTEGGSHIFKNINGVFSKVEHPLFAEGITFGFMNMDLDQDLELRTFTNSDGIYNISGYDFISADEYQPIQFPYDSNLVSLSIFKYFKSASGENDYISTSGVNDFNVITTSLRIFRLVNNTYQEIHQNPFYPLDNPRHLETVDYDQDGLEDLFAITKDPGVGILYKNTGGDFSQAYSFPCECKHGEWVDFNSDGHLDYVVIVDKGTDDHFDQIMLYEGFDGASVFRSTVLVRLRASVDGTLKVFDFDNDGDFDILLDGYLKGLYVNNNGSFMLGGNFSLNRSDMGEQKWHDYDLDGDLDFVIYVSRNGIHQPLILNNNAGKFVELDLGLKFPDYKFLWLDYNLDGYPDLLAFRMLDKPALRLYKNELSKFTEVTVSGIGLLPEGLEYGGVSLEAFDINVDGYMDFALNGGIEYTPWQLTFINEQGGGFSEYIDPSLPLMGRVRHWADIDNDGDSDIFGTDHSGINTGQVQLFENTSIDVTGPRIVYCFPNHSVLADSSTLTVRFHEPIESVTGFVKLYSVKSDELLAKIKVEDVNTSSPNEVSFVLPTILESGEIYIMLDSGAFKDRKGNLSFGIEDPEYWRMTIPDLPPFVETLSPIQNHAAVDPETSLILMFSESVSVVFGSRIFIADSEAKDTIAALVLDNLNTIVHGSRVEIFLTEPLKYESVLSVIIPPGVIYDSIGNVFDGIGFGEWSFTTTNEKRPPYLIGSLPENKSTEVEVSMTPKLYFSEPVTLGNGNLIFYDHSSLQTLFSISLDSLNTFITTDTVSISIGSNILPSGHIIEIQLDSATFIDRVGNYFAGVNNQNWLFTTKSQIITSVNYDEDQEPFIIKRDGSVLQIDMQGSNKLVNVLNVVGSSIIVDGDDKGAIIDNSRQLFIVVFVNGKKIRYKKILIKN